MGDESTLSRTRLRRALAWRAGRAVDALARIREPLVPPRHLLFDGSPNRAAFRDSGLELSRMFIESCHLEPDAAVLDVGSGMGRLAVPLTRLLAPEGRYEGFDVNMAGTQWCTRQISGRHPNFHFRHVDVANPSYNPNGSLSATEFRFPYPDARFDLVVLGSVFTHMLTEEVDHYLAEIERVLRPGGRVLATFFLLDSDVHHLIDAGRSRFRFAFGQDPCRIEEPDNPAAAVAYDKAFVTDLYGRIGLIVAHPVGHGSWSGREGSCFQDIVIAAKPVSGP